MTGPPCSLRAALAAAVLSLLPPAGRVLGDRPVDAVERIDAERFLVRAGSCRVAVQLVPRPRAEPGPQAFEARPDRPDCP